MKTFIRAVLRKTKDYYNNTSMILPILLLVIMVSSVMITKAEEINTGSYTISPIESTQAPEIQEYYNIIELVYEEQITDYQDEESEELSSCVLYKGYTTAPLNMREEPSFDAEMIGIIPFNTEIEFTDYNEDWYSMNLNGRTVYIYARYVTSEDIPYTSLDVTGDVRKSFMDYSNITSPRSRQYKLQSGKAYTGEEGIRMVNGRYLIALGSNFSRDVGQYIDLVLENGTVIPCILGDCKADIYTMNNNSQGLDGSTAEFIIQTSEVSDKVKSSGDCSNVDASWNSPVVEIRLYDKNVFS